LRRGEEDKTRPAAIREIYGEPTGDESRRRDSFGRQELVGRRRKGRAGDSDKRKLRSYDRVLGVKGQAQAPKTEL
jgi:hypothetical protein